MAGLSVLPQPLSFVVAAGSAQQGQSEAAGRTAVLSVNAGGAAPDVPAGTGPDADAAVVDVPVSADPQDDEEPPLQVRSEP